MGGFGSGWQRSKRTTVEDCLPLTLSQMLQQNALTPGKRSAGSWSWYRHGEEERYAFIGYDADLSDFEDAWLRLDYRVNGLPVRDLISLTTSEPNFGGARWWFVCPVMEERGERHRTTRLYLPPQHQRFGSRKSYGLTYTSCQESGQWNGFYRRLAADAGCDVPTVRAQLKNLWR